MNMETDPKRFTIIEDATKDDMEQFQKGLETYNMEQTNGEFNSPQPWLSLVLRDYDGKVVGGIITSTIYWTQYLEVLWVDEKYRGRGYGRDLVLEAHRLAKKQGCISSHTYTFSWQAPDFYQAVGYDLIATYDGYYRGITELILMKRLDSIGERATHEIDSTRFTISKDASEESQAIVRKGLGSNFDKNVKQVLEAFPHTEYKLVIKNEDGHVVGGIGGYTIMGTMFIEGLWVAEKYRGQGYGKSLLQKAEKLAKEKRCIAGQGACFTFQNLEFFKKQGYGFYGHTDAYPNGVKEYFLIKMF